MLIVAADIAGAASPSSVSVKSLVHGVQDVSVATHAEVVIGAPDCDSFVLLRHVGTREFLGQAVDVVEVAVGFVGMFLV